MNDYIGIYRVVCEFDRSTLKPIEDDSYIYCAKGGQVYRYNSSELVFYRDNTNSSNIVKLFKENGIDIISDGSNAREVSIRFDEKDVHKVCKLMQARTLGKDIKPTSKRNLKLLGLL